MSTCAEQIRGARFHAASAHRWSNFHLKLVQTAHLIAAMCICLMVSLLMCNLKTLTIFFQEVYVFSFRQFFSLCKKLDGGVRFCRLLERCWQRCHHTTLWRM